MLGNLLVIKIVDDAFGNASISKCHGPNASSSKQLAMTCGVLFRELLLISAEDGNKKVSQTTLKNRLISIMNLIFSFDFLVF